MSIRFIYGKSGTGKTTYCFAQIKQLINDNKKVYIITPEQFSFTAEKNLMKICSKKAVMAAEVITFERMAYRIINEVGGVNNKSITNSGKAILLTNIIEKQKENLNFRILAVKEILLLKNISQERLLSWKRNQLLVYL